MTPRASIAAGASFEVLPLDDAFGVDAHDSLSLSANGETVVGTAHDPPDFPIYTRRAARWDAGIGTTPLGEPPTGAPVESNALGVSADGSIAVGRRGDPGLAEAVIFYADGTSFSLQESLLGDYSYAIDASHDGSVVVGQDSYGGIVPVPRLGGYIWDAANGARSIGELAGYAGTVVPDAISDDGRIVTGLLQDNSLSPSEAFRWTEAGGLERLGAVDGDTFSRAYAISGDGSTIVGSSEPEGPSFGTQGFKWTEAGGMEGLGQVEYMWPGPPPPPTLPQTTTSLETIAYGASEDGSVIVGGGSVAWIHAEEYGGMIAVRDLLIQLGVAGLENWDLYHAVDVSADGRVITGWGSNLSLGFGDLAWRAVIPEPSTATLLGLGLLGLARDRRTRRRSIARARAIRGPTATPRFRAGAPISFRATPASSSRPLAVRSNSPCRLRRAAIRKRVFPSHLLPQRANRRAVPARARGS